MFDGLGGFGGEIQGHLHPAGSRLQRRGIRPPDLGGRVFRRHRCVQGLGPVIAPVHVDPELAGAAWGPAGSGRSRKERTPGVRPAAQVWCRHRLRRYLAAGESKSSFAVSSLFWSSPASRGTRNPVRYQRDGAWDRTSASRSEPFSGPTRSSSGRQPNLGALRRGSSHYPFGPFLGVRGGGACAFPRNLVPKQA